MFCWKRMLFASSESDQWCEEWPEISKFRWILKLENEFIWLHFVPENCKLILNIFRHSDLKFFHLQIWLIFCNPGRRWSDETLSQYCYSYFWLSANPHSTLRARPGWKRQCNRGSDWFQTKKKTEKWFIIKINKSVCTVTGKKQSVCDQWACERACTCSVVVTDCWVWEEGCTCCCARVLCWLLRAWWRLQTDGRNATRPNCQQAGEKTNEARQYEEGWKNMCEVRMRQIPIHQHI